MMHLCITGRESACEYVRRGGVAALADGGGGGGDGRETLARLTGEKQVTRSGQVSGKRAVLGGVWCSITMSRVRWGR